MYLYIHNHKYHYEAENLARAFFFDQDVMVISEFSELSEPYIFTSVTEKVTVEVRIGGFHESLSAPLSGDDELTMAQLMYCLLSKCLRRELPWGILTGVRPIKLFSRLSEENGQSEAEEYFRSQLFVSETKIALSRRVAANQRDILCASDKRSCSLYVSIPFCPTRCNYCSFVSQSIGAAKKLIPDYLILLTDELRRTAGIIRGLGLRLLSVYVGGGTPTTLSAEQLDMLLSVIKTEYDLSECMEFTVEAGRPDTVTAEKLRVLKAHGVTRISINPQTFSDEVLERIGRRHTSDQTLEAYRLARDNGLDNINMDLIAGLSGDTPESFRRTIDIVRELDPESVTVHTLAVKRSARVSAADAVAEHGYTGEMLAYAEERLSEGGYEPYYLYRQSKMLSNLENIGWAKPGFFSPYNVYIMEETHSILACGAGATTKLRDCNSNNVERIFNFKYPYEYISRYDELIQRKQYIEEFYTKYNI